MVRERESKEFRYSSDQDIGDADFIFADFNTEGVNPCYNETYMDTLCPLISTELDEAAETEIIAAFRAFLCKEKTQWEISVIQPLPGALRIRLQHTRAWMLDDIGTEGLREEGVSENEIREYERIYEVFGRDKADITLSYKQLGQCRPRASFAISIDGGHTLSFNIKEDETIITGSISASECGSKEYILTWVDPEHTKIRAQITRILTFD